MSLSLSRRVALEFAATKVARQGEVPLVLLLLLELEHVDVGVVMVVEEAALLFRFHHAVVAVAGGCQARGLHGHHGAGFLLLAR